MMAAVGTAPAVWIRRKEPTLREEPMWWSSVSFANRVAVVTGASSGIGLELARELARQGAQVGLIARRFDKLEELAAELRGKGATVVAAGADVGNREQVLAAVDAIRQELGPIDLMVANAGVGAPTLLEPFNVFDVEQMFRINVLGVIYSIESVLPGMLARKQGHIAAVSSLAAYKGLPGESAYGATKAAVNTYLEGLRIQLAPKGIHVTTICPGFIKTPMTDVNDFHMPFLLTAEVAARRIVGALRRRVKVYNFPLRMNLLMGLIARLPDWMVNWLMASYNEKPPMPAQPLSGTSSPGKQ
jgi:short-subunit dehydrogenase